MDRETDLSIKCKKKKERYMNSRQTERDLSISIGRRDGWMDTDREIYLQHLSRKDGGCR